MYLVKWAGLSYLECTWEWASELGADDKIREYHAHNAALPVLRAEDRLAASLEDTWEGDGGGARSTVIMENVAGLPLFMQALLAAANHTGMRQKYALCVPFLCRAIVGVRCDACERLCVSAVSCVVTGYLAACAVCCCLLKPA